MDTPMLKRGDGAAVVCCSNARPEKRKEDVERLFAALQNMGLKPVPYGFLYERTPGDPRGGTGRQRAEALMEAYRDPTVRAIFDLSGGDIANELLSYMDFEVVRQNPKPFFGYSDLTVILNAIWTKTGQPAFLYQVCNLIYDCGSRQQEAFAKSLLGGERLLFDFSCRFLQGTAMEGIVAGGNIRCLLKLAGTEFWPDLTGKILFLESFRGGPDRMIAFFSQLAQIGAFHRLNGILLGTFTELEKGNGGALLERLVLEYAGKEVPVAKTDEIGHGTDSKCLVIGEKRSIVW